MSGIPIGNESRCMYPTLGRTQNLTAREPRLVKRKESYPESSTQAVMSMSRETKQKNKAYAQNLEAFGFFGNSSQPVDTAAQRKKNILRKMYCRSECEGKKKQSPPTPL